MQDENAPAVAPAPAVNTPTNHVPTVLSNPAAPQAPVPPVPAAAQTPAVDQHPMTSGGPNGHRAPAPAAPEPQVPAAADPAPSIGTPLDRSGTTDPLTAHFQAELAQNPGLSYSLKYAEALAGGKVDMERAFGRAVQEGDTSLIDMAYLREAVGDKADELAQAYSVGIGEAVKARNAAVEAVHNSVPGGREALEKAVGVFERSADPAIRSVVQTLLDSGSIDNMKYAAKLMVDFARSSGSAVVPHTRIAGAPGTDAGLSAMEYRAELLKLGNNPNPQAYQALREARERGKAIGR